jgi:hypothetical protein
VSVFDVSQTDGEPLPEVPREPITGDSHAPYIGKLEAWARARGIAVEYEPLDHAGGYCADEGKRVVVSSTLEHANGKVRTLLHELAHAIGDGTATYKQHGRERCEVIVETAGFIVAGAIGLDTSGEAVPYLAGWGENDDALAAIKACAQLVDDIARELEGACGLGGERA